MLRVVTCLLVAAIVAPIAAASPAQSQVVSASEPGVHVGTTPTELQIMRFYAAVLDRGPDTEGLAYWHRLISTGSPLTDIADAFAVSEEFQNRFGVPPGRAGDERFLLQVYRNVLRRTPDAEGEQYWSELLAAGIPRAQVVLWFSESAEFIARTGLAPMDLPPFEGEILSVGAEDLGVSWREGCPVPPSGLRKLAMAHVDFAGNVVTGELIVNAGSAGDLMIVFQRLYEARYPIQLMRPVDEFDGSDDASMAANNTSAFNCRNAVFSSSWSRHAFGLAVDINPLVNPYVKGTTVLPPTGSDYADRKVHHPSLIREGDVVVQAFDAIGWAWGGRWQTVKDYQHFSSNNR